MTREDGWHRGAGGWALFSLGNVVALVELDAGSARWRLALGAANDRSDADPTVAGSAATPLAAMETAGLCWASFRNRAAFLPTVSGALLRAWSGQTPADAPPAPR